jgi:probable rRNA maturation factor
MKNIADPPANELHVRNRHPRRRCNARRLAAVLCAALDEELAFLLPGRRPRFELAFVLVDDRQMAGLHERYLHQAGPTDVITFDHCGGRPPPAGEAWICGDIVISLDTARRQAREFGTTWPDEVVRYAVHGVLHLVGLDDHEPAARRRMKRAEDRLVAALAARFDFRRLARAH